MNLLSTTSFRAFVNHFSGPRGPARPAQAVEVKNGGFEVDVDAFSRAYVDSVKVQAQKSKVATDKLTANGVTASYQLASSMLGPAGAVALAASTMQSLVSKQHENQLANDLKLSGTPTRLPGTDVLAVIDDTQPLAGVMLNRVQINSTIDRVKAVDPMAAFLIGQQISRVENRDSLGLMGVTTLLGELKDEGAGAAVLQEAHVHSNAWQKQSLLTADLAGVDYAVNQGFAPDAVLLRMRQMNQIVDSSVGPARPSPMERQAHMEMHFADKYAAQAAKAW